MRRTSKVIYCRNGQCGTQYATHNAPPHGTKWKIYLIENGYGGYSQSGIAHLLESNWDIDEKKVKESNEFYFNFI